MSKRQWKSGEIIWLRGDEASAHLVESGIVAYVVGGTHRHSIGFLGPGQAVLPTPGLPGCKEALADLVAITDVTLAPVDDPQPEASMLAVATAATERALYDLAPRVARQLLRMTELLGGPVVRARQDLLAIIAGVRRETLATQLSSWRDDPELIHTRYGRLIVRDREGLAALAGL